MKNVRTFNEKETVSLQKVIAVDGTSRKEAFEGLKAYKKVLRGHPGAILGQAIKAGLIKKEVVGSDITYYFINNDKGGEKKCHICEITDLVQTGPCMEFCKMEKEVNTSSEEKVLTSEEEEIKSFIIGRKYQYRNLKINDKQVWGIAGKAITLVDSIDIDPESGRRWYYGHKEFHNFTKNIKKDNSFDDGIEVAKDLINKYGRL